MAYLRNLALFGAFIAGYFCPWAASLNWLIRWLIVGMMFMVMLQVKSHKDFKDLTLSDAISVQLMATDLSLPPQKLILKRADKQGLYNALDIAAIWLDREEKVN